MSVLAPFADELERVTFVEASAGTGKTYAIEMLYLRLLVERRLTPEQIVVVTYTNAAAAELRERIRQRLQSAWEWLDNGEPGDQDWARFLSDYRTDAAARKHLLTAVYGFDRASISTIHGFCQRVLQEHAFDSGADFDVEMIADQTALVDEVVRDFVAAELYAAPRELIDLIRGDGFLGRMARFAALAAAQPDLPILPATSGVEADRDAWQGDFARARELWAEDADRILELRCDNPALHKNATLSREDLRDGLAAMLAESEPGAGRRYPGLAKLGQKFLASRTKVRHTAIEHEFFACCERLVEVEERMEVGLYAGYFAGLAAYARREIPQRKAAKGVAYFDDLLLMLRDALCGDGGEVLAEKLCLRFSAALIDEFQDTDQVQYEIFRRIFTRDERPLFLIGDPKQSIYAFRGADIRTYVEARADAARVSTLETNRRSSDPLVAAVNRLFQAPGAFVLDSIGFAPVRSTGEVAALEMPGAAGATFLWCGKPASGKGVDDYRRQVRAGVASRIVALLDSEATIAGAPLRPRDIAVLCRKNSEAAALQVELRQRGVPSVLTSDSSVFETAEANEMGRVLRALVEPRDADAIRAALCTPLCGVGGDEMVALRDDEGAWQEWVERFHRWRARWEEHGFMAAFRCLRDECDVTGRLLALRGGERQLTNYLHLAELLQVESRRLRNGPQGLADWLVAMSSDADARGDLAAEAAQVRLESDADAVVLTTIHKSKGLEYPVVFLPFLWSPPGKIDNTLTRFHDPHAGRSIWAGLELPDDKKELVSAEQRAEEMRLAYVALTRAKQAVFVVVPEYSAAAKSPLGVLLGELTRERLVDLSTKSGGAIAVEDLAVSAAQVERRTPATAVVEPAEIRRVSADWRVSSFSGLTTGGAELSAQEEVGIDRDEVEVLPPVGDAAGGDEIVLADLEAGTRIGLMIHSIFEDLDFQTDDAEELRALIAGKTAEYRVGMSQVDAIVRTVADVLRSPLPGSGFSLSEVERGRRLDEVEFILPVSRPSGAGVTPSSLAAVLLSHGAPVVDPSYAERVRGLGFGAFVGFLRGFVDMVFEHGGRWYVVDYKSNFLGRRRADYEAARLAAPMRQHDYFLQYLLYVVATDRYLRQRIPGYAYETHFGGVYYLFLRGMARGDASSGIFHDRPSAGLVADLSSLFAAGGTGG